MGFLKVHFYSAGCSLERSVSRLFQALRAATDNAVCAIPRSVRGAMLQILTEISHSGSGPCLTVCPTFCYRCSMKRDDKQWTVTSFSTSTSTRHQMAPLPSAPVSSHQFTTALFSERLFLDRSGCEPVVLLIPRVFSRLRLIAMQPCYR